MEDRALSIYVSYSSTALTIAWVVTLMIMVAGIVGNILTVVALLRKTERTRNMTSPFIIGLCLFDCLFCILVLPFNVLRFYSGTDFKVGVFCQLVPFVQYGNVGASLLFIVMITINRYIMIVHFPIYNSIYRPRNIAIMIIICVLFSYGMQIPTLLGVWGKYAYDERLLGCTIVSDTNGRSSKTTLFIMGFVVPCLIIICCYSRIFFIVRRSENKILAHKARDSMTSPKAEKLKKKEWRITKMVLLIFVCFIMCYLPITIMKVADRRVDYPLGHLMAYMLLYLSACVNPIIYASMNRRAFLKIFTCESKNCCGLKPISESNRAGGHKILSNAFQKCADWKIRHNSFEKSPFLSFVNFKTPYPGICQPTQQNTELKTKQLFIVNDSKIRNVEFFLPLRIQNIQRVGILNVLGAVDELSPLKKKPKIHYINNEVLGAIKHIPASSTDVIKDRVKNNQGIKIPCTSGANTNTTDSSFPDNSLSIHNEHQRTKEKSEISNTDSKEPKHYLSSFGGFRKDVQVMIHNLIFMFRETGLNQGSQEFLNFCSHKMTPGICRYIERVTETQYESSLWHRLKFGRVTASQLYAVAKCRTTEGYLVKNLLGARTWFSGSYATLRGKRLEEEVCQAVERQEGLKFRKCGLFLSGDYPILGASPDGINETYVLEIKCPASMKSFGKYISDDDKIGIKFMAQIQLQMLLSGRKKGIFCVAHPNFESSQQVRVKYVDLDEKLISSLTNPAIEFWKANVFPVLIKIKKESERGE